MSGERTNIIPEQVAVNIITIPAGITFLSMISVFLIFNNPGEKVCGFFKVSLTVKIIRPAMMANIPEIMKSPSKPTKLVIGEPKNCPTPIPKEVAVPKTPIPWPRLSAGKMSVTKAVAPVGKNPVEKP